MPVLKAWAFLCLKPIHAWFLPLLVLTLGGSAPALWRKMFSPLRPWILFWSCGQAVVAWGHKSPHGATLLLSFFYHACVEILDVYFVMHILRLLLWYFSTAGRSSGLASSEPTENFSLTWCWMTPGMTRSWPHFFFLYRSSKTVVPDSWHDCIRKICFWPAGGSWGRTWCSSAAQLKNCRKRGLNKIHAQQLFSELKFACTCIFGVFWQNLIRKTGAKNPQNGRKKPQTGAISKSVPMNFALKPVLLWKLSFRNVCCENLPVVHVWFFVFNSVCVLPDFYPQSTDILQRKTFMHACHDKNTQGSAKGPSLAKSFFRSMVLLACLTIPAACMASASQWRMSQECCMHVTWMLHACPMNVACCMSGAFCIHACRTHGMYHAWTAVAFLHACMYGPVFCMHEHGCMHADAKIVQLLLSSIPHVWTKRCVASPFL